MLLVRKPEGKRQVGRPKYMWVNIITMDLGGMGCESMYVCTGLFWLRIGTSGGL
jgi:hypothetical protein